MEQYANIIRSLPAAKSRIFLMGLDINRSVYILCQNILRLVSLLSRLIFFFIFKYL